MAYSSEGLALSRVIAPEIDTGRTGKNWGVLQGPTSIQTKVYLGTVADRTINFNNMNPPSKTTFMSKRIWIDVRFRILFEGVSAAPGVSLLQMAGSKTAPGVSAGTQYYDAPRCMPINNGTQNLTTTMNSYQFSDNVGAYFRVLTRYQETKQEQDIYFGASTAMPDQSLEYADLDGTPLNPLGPYGNSTQNPRGGLLDMIVIENTSTGIADTAIVEFTVREPFCVAPYNWASYDREEGIDNMAIYHVDTMSVQMNFAGRGNGNLGGLFGAIWSHSALGSTLTKGTASIANSNLTVDYLTAPKDLEILIPDALTYNYSKLSYKQTSNGLAPILSGQSAILEGDAMQLDSVPTLIYVFASEVDGNTNVLGTDSYLRITNIQITYANSATLLTNLREFDLWQMSVKNGCNMNWRNWQEMGAPICIAFGIDLPLQDGMAPSMRGSTQLQIQVTCLNQYGRTITPSLNCLIVSEGTMRITKSSIDVTSGILNEGEVMASRQMVPTKYRRSNNITGSGWFDKIKNFIKSAARPTLDFISKTPIGLDPRFQAVNNVAKAVGLGRGKKSRAGKQRMSGGALMSKESAARVRRQIENYEQSDGEEEEAKYAY